MAMARIRFDSYYGSCARKYRMHISYRDGDTIEDRLYFSPTHRKLLKEGHPSVQAYSNISAAMDWVVYSALWRADVHRTADGDGLHVAIPDGGTVYSIKIAENGDGSLKIHHICPECTKARIGCLHIPAAFCCYEAARSRSTPMYRLAASLREAGKRGRGKYQGAQERDFIRLMDEVYYQMRYVRQMDRHFELVPREPDAPGGEKLIIGSEVLETGPSSEEELKPPVAPVDWSAYRIERDLSPEEREMVPSGVFYVDRGGEEQLATEVVFNRDPLLLVGPASVGKSRLARKVFEHLGLPLLVVSASGDRDFYSLVATTGLRGGETVEVEAKILTAARKGYGILIDEVASLKPDRAMLLNSLLQEREVDLGTSTVVLHPDCRVVATCNQGEEYTGSGRLDPSTLDRFVPLHLDYLDERCEVKVVCSESGNEDESLAAKMVEVASRTRRSYLHGEISKPITTRDLIRWAKYSKGGDPLKVAEMMVVKAVAGDEEELLALRDLLEEVFG